MVMIGRRDPTAERPGPIDSESDRCAKPQSIPGWECGHGICTQRRLPVRCWPDLGQRHGAAGNDQIEPVIPMASSFFLTLQLKLIAPASCPSFFCLR